jgi:ABC-2 type transport system permease protein
LIFANSTRRLTVLFCSSLAIGLVFCLLFTLFADLAPRLSGELSIGYINKDNSAVSVDFERYLGERLNITLVTDERATLESELVEKHISGLIELPEGFGAAVVAGDRSALLVTYMDDYQNRALIDSYLQEYTASLDILAQVAAGNNERFEQLLAEVQELSPPLSVTAFDSELAQKRATRMSFTNVLGFYLIIGFLLALVLANLLYDDRRNGTYQRLRASNVHTVSYVVGTCAAGFLANLSMVLVFFGFLLVSGRGEGLPLGPAFVLCMLYELFVIGFALVCGLLVRGRQALMWIFVAASTIFSLLGGAFFPVEYAPQFMQQIAHIVPTFWFSDAVNLLLADAPGAAASTAASAAASSSASAGNWLVSAGILTLYSLLCALVAGVRFASRDRSHGVS